MDKNRTDIKELAGIIVDRLRSLNPVKVILFGSFAYGNPDENSDIDICVIREKNISKVEFKKEIRNRLKDILKAKDILVPSVEEYNFYKEEYGSVFMDIDRKGKVLWSSF